MWDNFESLDHRQRPILGRIVKFAVHIPADVHIVQTKNNFVMP